MKQRRVMMPGAKPFGMEGGRLNRKPAPVTA